MPERVWELGKVYRDTASKSSEEDQLLRWLTTTDGRTIQNAPGIRTLSSSESVAGDIGPIACVVLVSASAAGIQTENHWIDPEPDYERGEAIYWGDAKPSEPQKGAEEWPGNQRLRRSFQPDAYRVPTPILLFAKSEVGQVKFRGLGVITAIDVVEQVQYGGRKVENLLAKLAILDCKEVNAGWITDRATSGALADEGSRAPAAWRDLRTGRIRRLALPKDEIKRLGLASFPDTAISAFRLLTPEDIVGAIRRLDANEKHAFGDSTRYDLVFEGKHYPPKAVTGLACRKYLGRNAIPEEFSGGVDTSCFRALERLGFQLSEKVGETMAEQPAILLTWNPSRWPWTELQEDIRAVRAGKPVEGTGGARWSVGSRRTIPVGTRFYMLRQGVEPKGLMGTGRTVGDVYEDTHFDESRDDMARYVNIAWDTLLDPLRDGCLDVRRFEEPVLRAVHWQTQQSGISIPVEAAALLDEKWQAFLRETRRESQRPPATRVEPPQPPREARQFTQADALNALFISPDLFGQMLDALRELKNVVIQGPPGVGKTYLGRRLAFSFVGVLDDDRVQMVQFHQSYSYEDFVQGYRPTEAGFRLVNGIFYRFCDRARKAPDRPHVFIIDEINRGNVASIFGEMLMLIEPDKRGDDFAIPLTYALAENRTSQTIEKFSVPGNVHILGLMNTADRSLAIVDYALRRRFRFFTIDPQFNERFERYLVSKACPDQLVRRIFSKMSALNEEIRRDSANLGRGFQVGHSYFCPPDGVVPDRNWYLSVIQQSIRPLLEEYWFEDPDKVDSLCQQLVD